MNYVHVEGMEPIFLYMWEITYFDKWTKQTNTYSTPFETERKIKNHLAKNDKELVKAVRLHEVAVIGYKPTRK